MLTDYERSSLEWLNSLGIVEQYPYIENGISKTASSIYELYYKVVLSYETIVISDENNEFYSKNDLKNIESLIRYQREMSAKYSPFRSVRSDISDEIVKQYSQEQVKNILTKANRKNRGIYFISAVNGYCSTTLFENPIKVVSEESNRCYKKRLFGHISVVALETLRLFDNTELELSYLAVLGDKELKCCNLYDVYRLVFKYKNDLKLVNEKYFFSKQQRQTIKKLRKVGGIV